MLTTALARSSAVITQLGTALYMHIVVTLFEVCVISYCGLGRMQQIVYFQQVQSTGLLLMAVLLTLTHMQRQVTRVGDSIAVPQLLYWHVMSQVGCLRKVLVATILVVSNPVIVVWTCASPQIVVPGSALKFVCTPYNTPYTPVWAVLMFFQQDCG
jgi:hypothetical protein